MNKQRRIDFKVGLVAVAMALAFSATLMSVGAVSFPQSATNILSGTYVNPLQVALLRCFPANRTTQFTVRNAPQCLAFDGANIWVTNFESNTVSKV